MCVLFIKDIFKDKIFEGQKQKNIKIAYNLRLFLVNKYF